MTPKCRNKGYIRTIALLQKTLHMENQAISKNLLYQRKLKGYSQEELAEKTQVTVRTIQRIEKGEVSPHLQTVKLLAAALDIEVDELIDLEDPKEESIQNKWLLLIHGAPVVGLTFPSLNILIAFFLWIHKRDDNPIYDEHGRKVINFQITMTILFAFAFISLITIQGYGFILFMAVLPFTILMMVINIIRSMNTKKCFYPLSIPFIKSKKIGQAKVAGILLILISQQLMSCDTSAQQSIHRLDGTKISKKELTSKIEHLVQDANVQGLAVSIFNNNQLRYIKTFGYKDFSNKLPLDTATNIYGASLSKAVFAVLVMKLVEEGVIDLDTPLESYLPKKIYEYKPQTRWHDNYSDLKSDTLYYKITARMCLDHTSGFPNWRWFEPNQKLRVKFEPGTRYSYSGEGMVYLQVVLEKLTGKGLESLMQEYIFKPLKMHRSSYHWKKSFEDNYAYGHKSNGELYSKDKDNEPRSASTLETTIADYSKFMEAVLQRKIISKKSWNEIFKPQIRIHSVQQFGPHSHKDSTLNDAIQLSYGLGWGVFQTPYGIAAFKEGHGDGFQHYSIVFPEAKMGMVIMTNSDNGESIFKALMEMGIANTFSPWKWEGYVPYDEEAP